MKTNREPTRAVQGIDAIADPLHTAFEMALKRVCASLWSPCAVFDPATDTLILANPAFQAEFGALPTSRAVFEQLFEPVGIMTPAAGGVSPSDDIPEVQRVEVFCPRRSRWYSFQWSVLRNPQDHPLTLLPGGRPSAIPALDRSHLRLTAQGFHRY